MCNAQGDIIKIVDDQGDVKVEYTYDAWGKLLSIDADTGYVALGTDNPFRYRGYYYDNETGLYYLNARYYNPSWGKMGWYMKSKRRSESFQSVFISTRSRR